ncbi:hypothetical protein C8J56DRAFT_928859 [Mycena floridula]|nr:hypothetical protein C8J56DRAFT_928859 [Mycena floridula]
MLREIFVHCLPFNKAAATAMTDAPLLLGRICRSWRKISLTTPALWASIHVSFTRKMGSLKVEQLCKEAQAWIARSGTCPLTIGLTHLTEDRLVMEFIQYLTNLSTRWRNIEIIAPAESLTWLASMSKSDVPKLQNFNHMSTGTTQAAETVWPSLNILAGEELQDVGLISPWLQISSLAATSRINFGQLTRLTLNTASTFMDVAEILRRCPNLTESEISIRFPSADAEQNFAPITLLHLSSFTLLLASGVVFNGQVVLDTFFSSFNLPQLTSFAHNMGEYSMVSWIALARMSPIENLTLSLSDFRHESVLHYLRANTLIKRLQITTSSSAHWDGTEMGSLARLVAIDQASDVLCPFLEVLEVIELEIVGWMADMDMPTDESEQSLTDADLVKLVQRRAALIGADGKRHLKVVRIKLYHSVDIRVISQLDDVVASGLSLTVSYQPRITPESNACYWPGKPADSDWPRSMSWS